MNEEQFFYKDLSYKVIGLAMEVHRKLGCGFLEKVYENALMILLKREGIPARQQAKIEVYFEGQRVGFYIADIVIDNKIIIELKTVSTLIDHHRAQTLNYLKATGLHLALLINFGNKSLQYNRLVN